jgi:hypothetical protein
MQKSIEQLNALGANTNGVVSELPPVDAISGLVVATRSEEVVVVATRHPVAALFRRDLVSRARARLKRPVIHIVQH